ncbi:sugar phosphate isomerase/epimerase [Desulfocapsa sulfexigens DSM 10523]|uniref:Sugar phosphate isomerase/epimerase n=1 Tax=Desulfocapsa sulfexigens (strain DSM 10523 / SB164P1) TaxID=1167006 RepID=M1PHI5_DESSD|nr:TIM barrel protein [Desulfocapsa sulfexigens]AGF79065.1 sugar phosphate isomerase/epimerase [Desulfocapsa sulfexigens DSM 10523]
MEAKYKHITPRCFVNAPWYELKNRYLDLFLQHGIQPEIGLEGLCLYEESEDEFKKIAHTLKNNRLSCTLHAPFFDLAPGALDPKILDASRNKLRKAARLITIFQPKSMVCHLNFEENKQGYKWNEWLLAASETWQELLGIATEQDCILMLENTYETSPDAHETVLTKLDSENARFCLDVGHLMSFAKTPWQNWLPILSPWLGQLHLHDNNGEKDQHLGLGLGKFDFKGLFDFLAVNNLHPLVTLEPHSEDDLWHALEYLHRTKLLDQV